MARKTVVQRPPESDIDWTIHSLNIQGTFFERWCQKIIRQSRWNILSTNYPVEFPKHNGPLMGEQSALDIYAQLNKQTIKLTLLIECKKNNPEFIDWVFFPHSNSDRATHFSGFLINNHSVADIDWVVSTSIAPMRSLDWVVTSDAWETRGKYEDYKNGNKTKTSNTAITNAAHQIALATKAVFDEESENVKRLSNITLDGEKPYIHQIFIPIIVTTANLFTCQFDPEDINETNGEIPLDSAKLEKQPYLLYEYSLPAHFRSFPVDVIKAMDVENKDFGTRMDILVVNSNELPKFLYELDHGNT